MLFEDLFPQNHNSFEKKYAQAFDNLFQFSDINPDCTKEIALITTALKNISLFTKSNHSKEEVKLFQKNAELTIDAINTFCNQMNSDICPECKVIEKKLFDLIFAPEEGNPCTRVYSV